MFSSLRPSIKQSTEPLNETIIDGLISDLKEKYEKRIESKVAGRLPVNLRITASRTGTSEEAAQNFRTLQGKEVGTEIGEIFDRSHGRLLIVGLPGAGKTTLLLQLAVELLKQAESRRAVHLEGELHVPPAIPVLLNLATWRSEFASLDHWLQRILSNELGAPKGLMEKIHDKTTLVLLLDGLDEVPDADLSACQTALRQYGMTDKNRYVVSTRISANNTVIDVRNISWQVEVAPPDAKQIEINLAAQAGAGRAGAAELYRAIQKDALLKQSLENPFYLNTAQLLFASGQKWSEFGFIATDLVGRQKELVHLFVQDAVGGKVKQDYNQEKIVNWLRFLAERMEAEGLRAFELLNLQPKWWGEKWWHRLFFSLFLQLLVLVLFIPSDMIAIGILFCFIISFQSIFGWIRMDITNPEKTYWSWKAFASSWKKWAVSGFRVGIKGWLSYCFTFSILFFCFQFFNFSFFDSWFFWKQYIYSLTIIPLMIIVRLMQAGDVGDFSLILKKPYQRFTSNLSVIRFRIIPFSLLLHSYLRFLLFLQSSLPLRLVPFLNEMSRRHLLEYDGDLDTETGGGSWRWRHRIIQEYFLAAAETAKKDKL